MTRAAGRLAEAVEVTLVALQRLLAGGHVRPFLRVIEVGRDEMRQHVAAGTVLEAVVLVAVTVDAARGKLRRAVYVTLLAQYGRVCADQRLRC